MCDFRVTENSQFGVSTIIGLAFINLPNVPLLEPQQSNLSDPEVCSEPCQTFEI